jgi:trigger factor
MQVTETNADGLKREFKVVIAADDLKEKVEGRLQELSGQVKLPGFRPGKVPIQILKQRFGPSVMGEVVERAVNDSSTQALNERGLRPAVAPKIEIVSFDEGKDLEYSMEMELLPDIEPMDFAKLELEKLKIEVPEQEVEEALERVASNQKTTQPLAKPRKAKTGDVLVLDFKGTVHGEAHPGMSAEDHHLELGSNSFITGFEDQLEGVSVGDTREVKVTFPEEYGNEKLAGQPAVFDCTIKDILESVPMPIDDSLAVSLGEENLEAVRDKIRTQITGDYENLARGRAKRVLLDKLAEGHDFPVPATMVDLEFETIWKQIEADREKGNVDPDDEGKDEEALKEEYRAIAERRVRLGLLLSEVGRINEIDVSQEEVNKALMQQVQRFPGQEQEIFKFYQSNPEALAQLRAPLFEDKIIDFIFDLAQVSERKITPDQLRAELEADESDEKKPAKKKTAAKKQAKKPAAKEASAEAGAEKPKKAAAAKKKPAAKKK